MFARVPVRVGSIAQQPVFHRLSIPGGIHLIYVQVNQPPSACSDLSVVLCCCKLAGRDMLPVVT